jgi:hypothetical protein
MKRILAIVTTVGLTACVHAATWQPNMSAAMASLQSARASLQVATSNKGGHRIRAMQLIDAAMAEVSAGMAYADGN